MIYNLQVLRGFAALGVVVYHTRYPLAGTVTDFYGVAVFFVISGFIIAHSTDRDSSGFLLKRFIRVVPLYWLATLVFLIWTKLGFSNPLKAAADWAADPFVVHRWIGSHAKHALLTTDVASDLARSLLFIPYEGGPVLGVGWTLNFEVAFYLLFGVCLIAGRLAPMVACVALALLSLVEGVRPEFGYFVAGIACFYGWSAEQGDTRAAIFGVIAAALLIWFWSALTFMPVIVVAAALASERAKIQIRATSVQLVGSASYSIYLVHPLVSETMRAIGESAPAFDQAYHFSAFAVSFLASLALGVLVHIKVETPLIAHLRRRFAH